MKIIRLIHNEGHAVDQALRVLEAGGVAVVPTDTVYGMVGAADNEIAIKTLFAIKKRDREKFVLLFVKDIAQARTIAYISDVKARFLEKIWPGAVSIIFQHKAKLASNISGDDTIGMRMPAHSFVSILLEKWGRPLAQTFPAGHPQRILRKFLHISNRTNQNPILLLMREKLLACLQR